MVAPRWRDRGIGQSLVQAVREQARAEGFTHLRVYTAAKRFDDIIAFYRRCGFESWYAEFSRVPGCRRC